MKYPIIVNENGDLSVFQTREAVCDYLEPLDVKNGEYEAYDSSGYLLKLSVDCISHKLLGLIEVSTEVVVFEGVEGIFKPTELKNIVERYLIKVGELEKEDLQLNQLVEKLYEYLRKK